MKLNTKRTILVGLAFLSISAFWQLYDSIIPLILKNTFHISDTISGGIMALTMSCSFYASVFRKPVR